MLIIDPGVLEALPSLPTVLDPERARERIVELLGDFGAANAWHCVPEYVRFKAESGCLVGHRLVSDAAPDGEDFRWVTLFAVTPARARELHAKLATLRPRDAGDLRGLAADERQGLVLVTFPNDRVLRRLKRLLETRTLSRHVGAALPASLLHGGHLRDRGSRFAIVRFKPERRCVVRYSAVLGTDDDADGTPLGLYVRAVDRELLARLVAARPAIDASAPPELVLPRLLGADEELACLVEEDLGEGRAASAPAEHEMVGMLLAHLHGVAIPNVLAGQHSDPLGRASRNAHDLQRIDRSLGERALGIVRRLASGEPGPQRRVLLHGDFAPAQVLVRGSGVALLDLDRIQVGPPEQDLAWWAAQSIVASVLAGTDIQDEGSFEHLLGGYRSVQLEVDERALEWLVAAALVELAITPFRKLDPAFAAKAQRLLDEAESRVQR